VSNSKYPESYLGLLHTIGSHSMYVISANVSYGYVTNTKTKFVLILDTSGDEMIKDVDVKTLFARVVSEYIRLVMNPFYAEKVSHRMETVVKHLCNN
jgi:hypothetical protein